MARCSNVVRWDAVAILVFLAAGACSDTPGPGDSVFIPESFWVLASVETPNGSFDATELDQRPTLTFGLREDGSSLQVSGFGGCNTFGGRAAVTGGQINFEQFAATEIFCTGPRGEVETAYFEVLDLATGYTANLDRLVITDDDGSKLTLESQQL